MTTQQHSHPARRFAVVVAAATLGACGVQSTPSPSTSNTSGARGSGYAELSWVAPTQNVDGTPLSNLAGYIVRYGQAAGQLRTFVGIPNPGTTSVRIEGLSSGTWYFTVAAYTNVGVESAPSVTASKTVH